MPTHSTQQQFMQAPHLNNNHQTANHRKSAHNSNQSHQRSVTNSSFTSTSAQQSWNLSGFLDPKPDQSEKILTGLSLNHCWSENDADSRSALYSTRPEPVWTTDGFRLLPIIHITNCESALKLMPIHSWQYELPAASGIRQLFIRARV